MRQHLLTASLLATALTFAACGSANDDANTPRPSHDILTPAGDKIGTVKLVDLRAEGTEVTVTLSGLSEGKRAMHFHEFGKCEGPDYSSAGGHYNPTGAAHGMKMEGGPHAGDMMNIEVGADGTGTMTVINDRVSIDGSYDLAPLLDGDGTALIIHAKADDYMSQPSGAAGPRIGCAVLGG